MKKIKSIAILLLCLIIVISAVVFFFKVKNTFSRGKHKVTSERITETLVASQDIIAMKFIYKDAREESKDFFKGMKLPFLSDKYLFVIEGKIHLGYNLVNMNVKVDEDSHKIHINLPKIEILAHEFKVNKSYTVENSALVEMKLDEGYAKGEEIKLAEEEKVLQDNDILLQTKEQAEKTIKNLLMIGDFAKDYEIIFD